MANDFDLQIKSLSGSQIEIQSQDSVSLSGTEKVLIMDGATAKETTTQDIADLGGGSLGYSVYVALLSQSGTDAPVATVLENTLGSAVTWSRDAVGQYKGVVTGNLFPTDLTYIAGYGDFEGSGTPFTPILSNTQIVGYYALYVSPFDQDRFFMRIKNDSFIDADLSSIVGSGKIFLPKIEVYAS